MNGLATGDSDLFVVIVGDSVQVENHNEAPAEDLLTRLHQSVGSFLGALDSYGGRHAIIFGSAGNVSVVNDAIGMRSVFYAVSGGVVASHAVLVEQELGGKIIASDLPFRYGYPGNRTPYVRTRILTPNTYYWVTANVVRRFWPVAKPAPMTVNEAAEELLRNYFRHRLWRCRR